MTVTRPTSIPPLRRAILQALRAGPMTVAQLAEVCICEPSGIRASLEKTYAKGMIYKISHYRQPVLWAIASDG